MVSTSHYNAEFYFNRDVNCIRTYFKRRYNYESALYPKFGLDSNKEFDLDVQVAASGFTKKDQVQLETLMTEFGLDGCDEEQPCDEEFVYSDDENNDSEEDCAEAKGANTDDNIDDEDYDDEDYIIEQDRLGNTIRRKRTEADAQ
ncbi:Serine/threonine-protein kinase rio2 [Kickxella alabastrina]|nr:Serine/threonine-protein kinase rio2 [Kickxella alabastrina]